MKNAIKRDETVSWKRLQNRNPITMRYRGEDFAAFNSRGIVAI